MQELFTTEDAAKFLGVSVRTFNHLAKKHNLRPAKIGAHNAKFYSRDQITALTDSSCANPVAQNESSCANPVAQNSSCANPVAQNESSCANPVAQNESDSDVNSDNSVTESPKMPKPFRNDSYHKNLVDFSTLRYDIEQNVVALKSIPPEQLGARFLQPAKHGYICPNPTCRDGAGRDGTGMTVYHKPDGTYSYFCGKCGRAYDNIDVLGFYYGLNPKTDFIKIIKHATDDFDLPSISIGYTPTEREFKPEIPDKHKDLILRANSNLKSFVDTHGNSFRGLTFDTLNAFCVGYLSNWFARKGAPTTPRIIIPTSYNHYLARLDGNIANFNIPADIHLDEKEHRGSKELFNFKRALLNSADPIVFVVEGEFDAMSIYQATDGKINVIALEGSNLTSGEEHQLKSLPAKKNFVIMLDNDETGDEKTPILVSKFQFFGHGATALKLSDVYKDANEFLQADHDGLNKRMTELYQQAQEFFVNTTSVIIPVDNHKIDEWQAVNGVIKPAVLDKLKTAAIRINSITNLYDAATDTSTLNFLGQFRFYSCFSDVDKIFFDKLRDAHEAAKNKIRTFDKASADAQKYKESVNLDVRIEDKPSPEEYKLAELKPKKISDKVDTFANKAKKEHDAWLKQKPIDDLNAKREAYKKNPDTTQQKIPDCPIDLILPEGIYFNENYIRVVDYEKNLRGGGHPSVTALHNLIVPTKIIRNQSTHTTQYGIAIKTGETWRNIIFNGKILQDARAVAELGNFGAHIADTKMTAKYFSSIIAVNEQAKRLPEIKCYSQPGWHGDEFIDPRGGDDFIVQRDGIAYKTLFATKGDRDKFLEKFSKVMHIGEPIPIDRFYIESVKKCTVGAALLPPMLVILGLPNQQFLIWGKKNSAKSPMLKMGLAIYGDPTEGKLFRNMSSTDKNKMTIAAGLNDLPCGYDEAESAGKFADLQKAGYDFFGGVINQANKRNGEVREAENFRGVQIMTGENPIIEFATAKGGSLKRLIQLYLDQPFMSESEARDLHIFLASNHGHFLSTWIDYIKQNRNQIKDYFEFVIAVIEEDSIQYGKRVFDYQKYEQTNFRAVVGAVLAYHLFLVAVGRADFVDVQAAAYTVVAIMKALPTVDELDDAQRAIEQLKSYLDVKPKYFYYETNAPFDGSRHEPYEKYGIVFQNGDVAFFTSCFKKICTELGLPSYDRLLSDAHERGWLDGASRRYKRKSIRWHGEVRNVYYFKAAAFESAIVDDE